MSIPAEILKKVKLLEISTRRLVNNLFAGEYHSAFKGQGMTFSEFREYTAGDDIRAISWPVTARIGKPYIKKFDEERELTMLLIVDISGSGSFGSTGILKGEVIAHLSALMSFSAGKNNDPVGLILYSDQVEHFVPPKKGRGHIHRILRDIYFFKPKHSKTNLASALEFAQGVLKKRSTVFILSDFMDKGYDIALRQMGRKHEVVAVVVEDPAERVLPNAGLIDLHDAESGEIVTVDSADAQVRKEYEQIVRASRAERDSTLRKTQVDRIEVPATEDFIDPLIAYFRKRNKK